ncbi:MAG: hypothetical protein JKY94_14765 [Rhodobacteraceae bacterium]|nr:hypothetical protein [Paracoccaceae bacterium]
MLQILIQGLLLSGLYSLIAMGFMLIFSVGRVLNLAYGTYLMFGGYVYFYISQLLGMPKTVGVIMAALMGILMGVAKFKLLVKPLKGDHVAAYAHDVKACALGQASAAVVGNAILGTSRAQVETARDQLKAMLKQDGQPPDAPFDGLEVLIPARDYKNRHASILLAIEATLEAMTLAEQANCA